MCQGLVGFMLQAPLVNTEETTDVANEQETHLHLVMEIAMPFEMASLFDQYQNEV